MEHNEAEPDKNLRFDYINWRGELHTYVIKPLRLNWGKCKCHRSNPDLESWNITGVVVTRDGDARAGLGTEPGNRTRTFAVTRMIGMEEIDG